MPLFNTDKRKPSRLLLAQALLVTIAAWLVYAGSISLPFFSDDVYHLRWVETHRAVELFVPSSSFASYRPLPSLFWYVWRHTLGFYSAPAFHTFNLLLHVVNAWLAMALAYRLSRGERGRTVWVAGAVGFIFASFPLAYQAVLWCGALTHVLGACLLLLTLLFYDYGRRGHRRWLVLSWGLAMVAPFANEAGLVAPGLIALYEWCAPGLRSRRHLSLALAFLPAALVQPLIWMSGPAQSSGLSIGNVLRVSRLLPKLAYFAQGATFPVQFAMGWLRTWLNWEGWLALGVGVALASPFIALAIWRGRGRQVALACGWFTLTSLPPVAALATDYITSAPRLLYIPAVGISLLWAWVLVALVDRWPRGRGALYLALLGVVLVPATVFVRQRVGLYRLAARPMEQALAVSQDQEVEGAFLFVNMPAWMAYKTAALPVGQEGVPLMPSYVDMSDFIWANTGNTVDARAVAFANVRDPQPYWYGAWRAEQNWETLAQKIRVSERVYLCLWQGWDVRLIEAGRVTVAPAPELSLDGSTELTTGGSTELTTGGSASSPQGLAKGQPLAVFDGALTLWNASLVSQDEGADLRLQWTAARTLEIPDSVFVHVLDEQGQLVTQADGVPLAGLFPFWLWQVGDQVRDVRWLHVPGEWPSGTFAVSLGLYNPSTGARRAVYDVAGERFPDDVVPVLQFTLD